MNILVTGSSGFIGRHLIGKLLTKDHRLFLLSSLPFDSSLNSSKIVNLNLRLSDWRYIDWSNIDLVVNLASYGVNTPNCTSSLFYQINTLDTVNFLMSAIASGVKNIIHTGSCFEYGSTANEYLYLPATAPLRPLNDYSFSKAAASLALLSLKDDLKFSKVSLYLYRLFHVYGIGEKPSRFWPQLVEAALSNQHLDMSHGEQIRDFINVDVVVSFLLEEISKIQYETSIKVQNIGSGQGLTLADFARREWRKLNSGEPLINFGRRDYRPNEIMRLVPCLQPTYY